MAVFAALNCSALFTADMRSLLHVAKLVAAHAAVHSCPFGAFIHPVKRTLAHFDKHVSTMHVIIFLILLVCEKREKEEDRTRTASVLLYESHIK